MITYEPVASFVELDVADTLLVSGGNLAGTGLYVKAGYDGEGICPPPRKFPFPPRGGFDFGNFEVTGFNV